MVRIAEGRLPPTVAQQIFVIGSGLAGGAAGFLLAKELAKVEDVPVNLVAGATFISVLFTFGAALFLARSLRQEGY